MNTYTITGYALVEFSVEIEAKNAQQAYDSAMGGEFEIKEDTWGDLQSVDWIDLDPADYEDEEGDQ